MFSNKIVLLLSCFLSDYEIKNANQVLCILPSKIYRSMLTTEALENFFILFNSKNHLKYI